MVKSIVVVVEVSNEQVEFAVMIIVAQRDSHASLLAAVLINCRTRRKGNVLKGSVAVVVIKKVWRRIVCYIDVYQAIAVKIAGNHAQPIEPVWIRDTGLLCNVAKRTIAVVVIERIARALQSPGPTLHRYSFVLTGAAFAELRQIIQVE